jgi:phosphomevalonate kinase
VARPGEIGVRVPGKLMLAGEYSVLAGAPAVVCAIGRHLSCSTAPAPRLAIDALGQRWEEGDAPLPEHRFVREAVRAAQDWLAGRGRACVPLSLSLQDDFRAPDGSKLGLGGSACACVGAAAAVLVAAGEKLDQELVFKLAAVAHARAQERAGSALDVAAASFGGTLFTWRFEVGSLLAGWRAGPQPFATVVERAELPARERPGDPPGVLIAFSGTSASTPALVAQVERYASADRKGFSEFVARSSAACDGLRRGLAARDEDAIAAALRMAQRELEVLGERSQTPIVTEAHRRIIALADRCSLVAKVSGAGGGDCCVALGRPERLDALAASLEGERILALRLPVDGAGVAAAA